jgi:hypothetical protein
MQNNMKKSNKLKGTGYALICDDSEYSEKFDPLVCGIFASLKEAKQCLKVIKDCPLKHSIHLCDFVCEITPNLKEKKGKTKRGMSVK